MKNYSFRQVEINNGFWKRWQDVNRKITIYSVMDRFKETGRFDAFKCDWKEGMPNKPHIFWDSDVAKWMEGAAYIITKEKDSKLEKEVEALIDEIEKNQDESGYFNTYFTVVEPENRFKRRTDHELYCAGHLIEAAVAYFETTKRDRFLKLMCKYADYIYKVFVEEQSAAFVTCGHEEIELALVRLYRCTQDKKYLELALFFINQRGNNSKDTYYDFANARYDQSHLSVREQFTAEGHCVRACYLYAAMADIAKETGDRELLTACQKIFDDIISKKMYITGGIGQSHIGEAFTVDYDLPNKTAYAETCAAISLVFFAQRMLELDTNSKYSDTIERAMFNGILSGISLDGDAFFYENPLEIDLSLIDKDVSVKPQRRTRMPITQRVKIFGCSCCPPNLNRFLASIGDYIYSKDDDTYFIHQYMSSCLKDGNAQIEQITDYPNDGKVIIKTKGIGKIAFRIPSWCENFSVNAEYELKSGYAFIKDVNSDIEINFEIKPVLIQATPKVRENCGKVALMMGPKVYCLEGIDNGANLKKLWIDKSADYEVVYDELFDGLVIYADGYKLVEKEELYYKLNTDMEKVRLKFIPYHCFANRGETDMCVWINYK